MRTARASFSELREHENADVPRMREKLGTRDPDPPPIVHLLHCNGELVQKCKRISTVRRASERAQLSSHTSWRVIARRQIFAPEVVPCPGRAHKPLAERGLTRRGKVSLWILKGSRIIERQLVVSEKLHSPASVRFM